MNLASQIKVAVETQFVADHSSPDDDRYVFAYHITIHNSGAENAQLMRRYWLITDANGQVQEVEGEGVVGEQPVIEAGADYQYTSGTILETPVGTMEGRYELVDNAGETFSASIPPFRLSVPGLLH